MQPFQLSSYELLQSVGRLVICSPLSVIFFVMLAILLLSKSARSHFKVLFEDSAFRFSVFFCLALFLSLLVFLGPFGAKIDNRHFSVPLALIFTYGAVLLFKMIEKLGSTKIAAAVIFVLALGYSGVDSNISRIVKDWSQGTTTTAMLLRRKPVLAGNRWLSEECPQARPKVLALTSTNTSYFLACGEFWHQTMTYPLWDSDILQRADFVDYCKANQITHVLVENSAKLRRQYSPAIEAALAEWSAVKTIGEYRWYAVK
jgi:hypothetical protein